MRVLRDVVLILNYHRLGIVDAGNPFHRLHSIPISTFKRHIIILSKLANFLSLQELLEINSHPKGLKILLTFDDVSRTVLEVTDFLFDRGIPFAIAPNVSITQNGYGVRDKVYFIESMISKDKIKAHIKNVLGDIDELDARSFSFYNFTKSNICDPYFMESEIIDPLFDSINGYNVIAKRGQVYLSWEDILELREKGAFVMNHGLNHYNYQFLSDPQLRYELDQSHSIFVQNGMDPHFFVLPFGSYSRDFGIKFTKYLRRYSYQALVTVNNSKYLGSMIGEVCLVNRVQAPVSTYNLLKYILGK